MLDKLSIPELILLVGALTTLVGAIAAAIVTVTTALRKIDAIIPIVAKIDAHVNSKETKLVGDIAARDLEIALLREMNSKLENTASLLAQAKVVQDTKVTHVNTAPAATVLDTEPIVEVLKEVNIDTTAIVKNTEKTEKDMKELKNKK